MSTVMLLATDHCDADVTVRTPLVGAACALAPGDGPHLNEKSQRNEDSVAIVPLPGGVAALVADAHHGAGAGERLCRNAVALLESAPPSDVEALKELVLKADEKACRLSRDASQSTLLLAALHGNRLDYVGLADSLLVVVSPSGVRRATAPLHNFGGGSLPLRTLLNHPSSKDQVLWEWGSFELSPGDVVLLATDGLEEDVSGLTLEQAAAFLRAPGAAETRARALVERVRSAAAGGGRDNIGLVVLCP